jgi:hypothetical protein
MPVQHYPGRPAQRPFDTLHEGLTHAIGRWTVGKEVYATPIGNLFFSNG